MKTQCAICDKSMFAGEEYAVIYCAGFNADGIFCGECNEDVVKVSLCSALCRDKHVGKFWRCIFPVDSAAAWLLTTKE